MHGHSMPHSNRIGGHHLLIRVSNDTNYLLAFPDGSLPDRHSRPSARAEDKVGHDTVIGERSATTAVNLRSVAL